MVLDGDPELGKSTVTLDLAARISAGRPMPDGTPTIAGGVVLLSAEDGAADTVRPRLDAAGANLERIVLLKAIRDVEGREGGVTLPDHIPELRHAVEQVGAVLVIVDTFTAYLSGAVNSRIDHDIRRTLAPLAQLAEATGATIVLIRHLNKQAGGNPLYRGGGSIGIIGAARMGLLVAPDPDALEADETRLVQVPADPDERHERDEARDVLDDLLAAGAKPAKDVRRQTDAAGLAWRTVRRAADELHVARVKRGFGSTGEWVWELPVPKVPTSPITQNVATLGECGHLNDFATTYDVSEGGQNAKVATPGVMDTLGEPRPCPHCHGSMNHYGADPAAGWVCPACYPAADAAMGGGAS